ncbi:MAG: T9SS type A sorting domain-containing protein [Ignavibacteriaceae bacterium]|jgi:hypothetical protein
MKKLTTMIFLLVALLFSINDIVKADVYPFYIRVTQPTNETPFDGSFTDGTGAAIRFYTPFSTVTFSATVNIYSGATLIKTITKADLTGTDNYVLWDGSTDASAAAPNGSYTVGVTTTQNSSVTGYTAFDAGVVATGLSTRGVTVVNNPQSRNNGFAYGINGGSGSANPWEFVGLGRVAMTGELWGHVKDSAYVPTTGIALGGSNRRYSPSYAEDGYIYSVAYNEKKIMRVHPDTLDNEFFTTDTVPTNGTLLDVEVVGVGATKAMIITSTTQILYAEIGESTTFSGTYTTLLNAETGMTLWSAQAGGHSNQKFLYVVVRSALANIQDAVFKFDFSAGITTKTFADTVWGAGHFVVGDAVSLTMKNGSTAADDILYLSIDNSSSTANLGDIFALTNLDAAAPTVTPIFVDPDNNTTSSRGEVGVDQGGNLIYFENSNEQIFVIEAPTTSLSYTNPGIDPFTISSSGIVTPPITIADARLDANADGKPDKLGQVVTIIGTVNSVNTQTSGTQYTVQDATGGIALYKGGTVVPFNFGDVLQITGTVAFYNGLVEITPASLVTGIIKLDSNQVVTPTVITISEFLANGEKYESTLIELNGVTKTTDSPAWPTAGTSVNMKIWDGKDVLLMRIDSDTNIDDSLEVNWPVNVKGVASQFSSTAPYNSGYQLIPSYYSDFTQGVPVAPLPYFHLATPANNAVVEITDSNATYNMTWDAAVDFNNDAVVYQFVLLQPVSASSVLSTPAYSYTGTKALSWLGASDTLVTKWTVKAKGKEVTLVSSVDTFNITFIRKIPVGVNDKLVPDEFYVNQNYPNPFNPSTTISFGLAKESFVDLRVYNVLGQEVAVLIGNQMRKAGNQQVKFDASSLSSGTYIYRLKTDNQVVTKKMILMK